MLYGVTMQEKGVSRILTINPVSYTHLDVYKRQATEVDRAVAKLIVEQIPDGACLQLGIGGMPNTVGAMLCESDLKDLGVHTEM